MSTRLNNFTHFANALLPHEVSYLLSVQQLKDPENISILELIYHNTHNPEQIFPYRTSIDKRKYSNLKNWINERLDSIDVDAFYNRLLEIDRKITLDNISPKEEDMLIKYIKRFDQPPYYFIRFYEIIRNYRFYLVIRFRHYYNRIVDRFLMDYQDLYDRCIETNRKLHEATIDIVNQYALNNTESRKWEEWLIGVFYNEKLDGQNRYMALIRLTMIYFNYREYDKLNRLYDDLDEMMKTGQFYSRRILLNYYSNRVMLHSKRNEPNIAASYGFLSIRQRSGDYLHYINNLCAVLLRQNQNSAALKLMQDSFPELRNTKNHHTRVGFVSFYIRALNKNNRTIEAAGYAETFLSGYKEQIFEFRWHTFFAAYIQSLIAQSKYHRIISLAKKYKLADREKEYGLRAVYIPTIAWYIAVAEFMEDQISYQQLTEKIIAPALPLAADTHKCRLMIELAIELHKHIPDMFLENGNVKGIEWSI